MSVNYWIKLYCELLDDLKVGRLSVTLKWRFVECLLVAGENGDGGVLPLMSDMSWRLRSDPAKLKIDLIALGDAGLLALEGDRWRVKKFSARQKPSKAALRQREYRKRKKEKEGTEADTDTYSNGDMSRNGDGDYIEKKPVPVPELQRMRRLWKELFPDKPQPRATNKTLNSKVKTRMKSIHFKVSWKNALTRASVSQFLQDSSWFTLGWFLKNDDNYEKCLNGNYDDRQGQIIEPAGFPAIREVQQEIINGNT